MSMPLWAAMELFSHLWCEFEPAGPCPGPLCIQWVLGTLLLDAPVGIVISVALQAVARIRQGAQHQACRFPSL
jgi:hypothetical protein